MSGGGTSNENQTLHTDNGTLLLTPAVEKARGQQKIRIEGTRFVGIAILALVVFYGFDLVYRGTDDQALLTCIGTLAGVYFGHIFGKST